MFCMDRLGCFRCDVFHSKRLHSLRRVLPRSRGFRAPGRRPVSAGNAGINPQVFPGAPGPAEIALHGPLTEAPKHIWIILIEIDRLPDHIQHITAGIVGKGKSVAGVPPGLIGLDRVLQPTSLPDNGHRAVAHGDHLAQPAWLTLGGHQKQVCAGIDGHRQIFVIVQANRHAAAVLLCRPVEKLLILPVSFAQNH